VTSPESISGRIEYSPDQLAFAQLAEVDRQAKRKVSELPQADITSRAGTLAAMTARK
jgi:hypothetical protein